MVGGDDSENRPAKAEKRVRIGPQEIINKMKKQISSTAAAAVAPLDSRAAQLLKDQRAKRAAERAAREEAERLAKETDWEDANPEEPAKEKRTARRRSMSTTISVSDLPRASPRKARHSTGLTSSKRKSAPPAKMVSSLKNRLQGTVKAALSSATPTPRMSSQTALLKPAASSSSTDPKSMRQSRISFGGRGIGFNVSPKRRSAPEDEEDRAKASEDAGKGPKIPKRGSSLKAGASNNNKNNNARPSTAKSLAKGVSKAAAAAKLGVQGDKAIRKTIRAVSGAE
jgi:hypothetical protein